jgi:DNA-binding winged helix-turn-helix (wHTH) protein/tetratricopeptide (TPR) repeat protein
VNCTRLTGGMAPAASYRFGPFRLDTVAYRLTEDDRVIPAPPKVLDLLRLLASQPTTLVTKDAILAELWPGIAVTDNAITQVVSELRQALGDDAGAPTYVQTVPRRGYRFVATVDVESASPPSTAAAPPVRRTIAVSDFQNLTAAPDVAWLASGIAETISNDLRALRALSVIDRAGLPGPVRLADLHAARAMALDWLVVGSYQRSGELLRITSRVIDVATGEAIAQSKADGQVADAFSVQDQLVRQLLADLHIPVPEAAAVRIGTRETSSIDAYRALTEGRLKLESLDPAQVPDAIADFDRALTLDPRYALAYVGLAEARFWQYEASRARNKPDLDELRLAISHARRAVDLDAGLGEAHASLALFLGMAGQQREAVDAGRRAVALEPNDWRHRFRLGAAAWGTDRLTCMAEVERLYPELAHTYAVAAMTHVARGHLAVARDVLERGVSFDDLGRPGTTRFPANGLHWLLGLVRWALDDDLAAAREAFQKELVSRGSALYAAEYSMDAYDALGFLALAEHRPADADAMFARALATYSDHARSLIGRAQACRALKEHVRAQGFLDHADRAILELAAHGRGTESAMARAYWLTAQGDGSAAADVLSQLLDTAPPGFAGWTMPVEPWCRNEPAIQQLFPRLAERAR